MSRRLLAALAAIALGAAPLRAQPSCTRDHPGRQHRAESLFKRGDARMAWSAAGHTTLYAVERYGLRGRVTEGDVDRAIDKTYEFLKWKLGNPSAVAAQWLTAGYQHFDRGYVDEAGAALLGFDLPSEKGGHSMFWLPPELVDLWMFTEKLQNTGKAYLLNAFFGIPKGLTKQVLDAIVDQEGRALKRLGFNIPKDYDFPNELVEVAALAKRDPVQAKAKFLVAVEAAARHEQGGATSPAAPTIRTAPGPRMPAGTRPPGARPPAGSAQGAIP